MGMEAYQNRKSDKKGLEDFPTPPWATRLFCKRGLNLTPESAKGLTAWEPCANRGFMVRPLQEYFGTVIASDIEDYGVGYPVSDFMTGPLPSDYGMEVDWVITNPPFNISLDFALRALEPGVSKRGVALFQRSSWMEGVDRYERLFSKHPPSYICQYVGRVPIVQGRVDPKAATAMPYSWYVWDHQMDVDEPVFRWLPHERKLFEKETDYDEYETGEDSVG